ncbi:hypothetical protein ACFQMA_01645 [Halosimplex aquaticum]|uniref:Uncharacterized protein n=1 Tax=Halosimplex aquaticum TaxID=3026162 RepID=A0ABD5XYT2_9EURY|nr:hypothetical protein [Halosimplex aquaticum]
MEQLYSTLDRATQTRLRDKLRGNTARPSVEWLLVADGNEDTAIRYLVGITDEERHDELERILRTALPNTYELQTVAWHPNEITSLASTTDLTDLYTTDTEYTPATEADRPPLVGVDYHGRAERPPDWQTPLTPLSELTNDSYAPTDDTHRLPLATLVETMRDADAPVVYQVLCRPYRDISPDVEEYELALETGTASLGGKLREALFPRPVEEDRAYEPPASDRERLDGLAERDTHRTFQVTARAVVFPDETGRPSTGIAEGLASALSPIDGPFHRVEGTIETDDGAGNGPGTECFAALCDRVHDPVA